MPEFVHSSNYNLICTSYLLIKICRFKFNGSRWCQLLIFVNRLLENLFYYWYQADHCDTRNDCYSQDRNNSNEAFTNFKIFSPKSFSILENIPTYYTSDILALYKIAFLKSKESLFEMFYRCIKSVTRMQIRHPIGSNFEVLKIFVLTIFGEIELLYIIQYTRYLIY